MENVAHVAGHDRALVRRVEVHGLELRLELVEERRHGLARRRRRAAHRRERQRRRPRRACATRRPTSSTAWARLSDEKAGSTGKVMIASASAISSFSSPVRSRPNRMPTPCPCGEPPLRLPQRLFGRETRFIWPRSRAVVAKTKLRSATASRAVWNSAARSSTCVGAGGRRLRPLLRPAVARRDEPQFGRARNSPWRGPPCRCSRRAAARRG